MRVLQEAIWIFTLSLFAVEGCLTFTSRTKVSTTISKKFSGPVALPFSLKANAGKKLADWMPIFLRTWKKLTSVGA
ncbi:hypothetical protein D3C85_1409070 [compost metagenome]